MAIDLLGTFTMTATYGGNHILIGASDFETHTVVKADTTTTIVASDPNPSLLGQPITVTFSVTSPFGIPTGPVTVTTSLADVTCSDVLTNSGGQCSLTLPMIGTFTLTADYAGDDTFNPSSDVEIHIVEPFSIFLPVTLKE